jgi:hypothetical protein
MTQGEHTVNSRTSVNAGLTLLLFLGIQSACGPQDETSSVGRSDETSSQAALTSLPAPNPPPDSCDQRNPDVTSIQVVVRIDQYQGLITGRNGTHEIAYGTITGTSWVYDSSIVDTSNVELAMNVKSPKDSSGLPHEIKLSVGQSLEVEGEYIPASSAGAHDSKGAAAVIHYSHAPCGYVTISGTVYR